MIYSSRHNVCIYNDRPQAVKELTEGSALLPDGRVAVPATLHNMRVMTLLKQEVVSPMQDYDWPIKQPFKPFAHQKLAAAFMALNPRSFNLSDIGTGKTLSALWAADYLMSIGAVKRALILTPLSTIQRVWGDEIFTHFMNRRTASIVYGTREKRLQRLKDDVDFYIINHDGLAIGSYTDKRHTSLGRLAETIIAREDIDLIIIDEGSVFKEASRGRYRVLRKVLEHKPHVWWMTATPTPNTPVDAWAQARAVRPDYQESKLSFESRTTVAAGPFRRLPRPGSADMAAEILRPAIRFTRAECPDLPPVVYETRDVELSDTQKKMLKEIKKSLAVEYAGTTITAINEAALRSKLIQITLGAIYDANHDVHLIDCKPRMDCIKEIIEEAGDNKIIVFASLTSVVNLLYKELCKDRRVAMITGATSLKERDQIFLDFKTSPDLRLLVAHPGTMSHGLTLTEANIIIWYGITDHPETYIQANGRINRTGQTKSMLIFKLAATALEREVFRRLEEKESLQGMVLEIIEGKWI